MFLRLGASCPSNYNPADYFIQILAVVPGREDSCRHAINRSCDSFKSSELGEKLSEEIDRINVTPTEDFFGEGYKEMSRYASSSKYKASWCEQFRAVLWRSWLSNIKEPILIKVRLLQTIVGIILS